MRPFAVAVRLAVCTAVALGGSVTIASAGIEGHTVTFEVRSSTSDTACVSWYETDKDGAAKDVSEIDDYQLEDLPFSVDTDTGSKVGRWGLAAWPTDDCASTADVEGKVTCRIRVDGKVKERTRETDAIAFCFV